MAKIGRIGEFDESFELWSSYQERLEQYFLANEVKEEKKVPVLLSVVGGRTYGILRDLTSPDVPGNKTYEDLTKVLKGHFSPTPIQIAERFRFHKRDQKENESVRDFNAAIRKLSEHCGFTDLSDALQDRLVCGIRNEQIQKKLLTEKDLKYDTALEMAVAIETASKDAIELRKHQSAAVHKVKVSAKPHVKKRCYRCNGQNHDSDDCRYKNETCHKCKRRGHIQRACRDVSECKDRKPRAKTWHNGKKKQTVHTLNDSSDEESLLLGSLYTEEVNVPVNSVRSKSDVIWVTPTIEQKDIKMELDTGSAVTIIPASVYREQFKNCSMSTSTLRLKTYTGETIIPLGKLNVNVQMKGQHHNLDLHVVETNGPPLFGRDWLNKMKLDWPEIKSMHRCSPASHVTVESLRKQYDSLFQDELGKVNGIQAHIKVKQGSNPKFCKARTVPYAIKPKVEEELDRLVQSGILSKVETSEWGTPIVPVMKKNGSVRICGDFKVTVNQVLEIDQYPLPKIEDIFASLSGGEKFTKLDLKNAYLQMEVRPEDRKYLTINTHKGLFQYNQLPFGIASAPAIWQRTMDQVLQGLDGVQSILDDMIITGQNNDEHLKNLEKVLERLEKFGMRLNEEKCKFFMDSIEFCGHKIDKNGLHKTEEKVNAVANAATPENVSQLRALLGMVNYYARFLPNLATVLRPLHHLLEKGVQWKWTDKCQEALVEVKRLMMADNVLTHYDPNLPVLLSCDASPYGLGVVLSHRFPNGDERPIAYASRTLNSAERNYSQLDKEALGIVWGVKRFHTYLYGRNFVLVTDHQPLVSIFHPHKGIPATSAARLQRYALYLSGFCYTIEYKGTKRHGNADGLSRLPLANVDNEDVDVDGTHVFMTTQFENLPVTCKEVQRETARDPVLSHVYEMVMNGWSGSEIEAKIKFAPFFNRKLELSVHQGCVLWGVRVIIPNKLRSRVLEQIHEGHLGIVKMKMLARSYVWWPGIDAELESVAKQCQGCLLQKSSPGAAPVHPWEWPQRPWQRVHVDFAGPFEGTMFLLMVDAHSKWPEIIPMSTTTASKTVEVMREVFSRNGLPECIVSDNGPQFVSEEFDSFMKVNGIRHVTSAPYHPRTNGLAERLVFTFKQAMKASRKNGGTVQKRLSNFLLVYRTTPHATTNETPSALFMGRALQTRLSLLKPNREKGVQNKQEKMFANSKGPSRSFDEGESVCVRDYRVHGDKWTAGTVVSQTGPLSYKVNVGPGSIWRRHTDQIIKGHLPLPDQSPDVRGNDTGTVASEPVEQSQPTEQQKPVTAKSTVSAAPPSPRRNPVRSTRNKPPKRLDL